MREDELVQLGAKLQEARKKKKIELEAIAEQTKINIGFLKKMEAGKFDFLPELYVRNFLKLYLNFIGQDASDFLNEYDSITKKSEPEPEITTISDEDLKKFKPPRQFKTRFSNLIERIKPYIRQLNVLWIILGVVIIAVIIYSVIPDKDNGQLIQAGAPVKSIVEAPKSPVDTSVIVAPKLVQKKNDLNLELKALERTWLQITVDDSAAQEHIFDRGMNHSWNARDRFKLLIGNGSGVRLFLNGKDLGPLGQTGQVVKFDVTEDGIKNSSF